MRSTSHGTAFIPISPPAAKSTSTLTLDFQIIDVVFVTAALYGATADLVKFLVGQSPRLVFFRLLFLGILGFLRFVVRHGYLPYNVMSSRRSFVYQSPLIGTENNTRNPAAQP